MPRLRHLTPLALAAAAVVPAAASAQPWESLRPADLRVTSGSISNGPNVLAPHRGPVLFTGSPTMRAVERDGGQHAAQAALRFRFLKASAETRPLGSGAVVRQIGLKLRASDPCNLVYAMWREQPKRTVEISVKRNPGQSTSAECGPRGYSRVASLPVAGAAAPGQDHRLHTLEARTRRAANGDLALSIRIDGVLKPQIRIVASRSAGLDGPVGVRSDNGEYAFALAVRGRG